MPRSDHVGMGLRGSFTFLRRRKWVIVLSVLIATGAAVLVSQLRTPVYEATAKVLIEPTQSPFDSNQTQPVDRAKVETEIQVIESEPVRAAAGSKLGTLPAASVEQVGSSAVIAVSARSPQAARAAAIANTYATAYIDHRRQKQTDTVVAAAQQVKARIDALQRQIDEADALAPGPTPETSIVPDPERQALVTLRTSLREKLEQLEVERNLGGGGPEMGLMASVPTSPVGASTLQFGLVGLGLGLLIGTTAAFLLDRLDDSVETKADVERSAPDVPVVGVIPGTNGRKDQATRLVSSAEPNSQAAEAYRTLRTSIQYMSVDHPVRTLLVTSPGSGEGKTTTVANLAVALARAGQSVVVVSCDLRRPRIHEFLGLSDSVGFTSVLLGETPLSSAFQEVPGEPRIRLLSAGPLPPNPSELLSSPRSAEVLSEMTLQADIVLLDCPPVLPVTDAALLSTRSDGVILVTKAGRTTRQQIAQALELLRQVGAPVIGIVLNGASVKGTHGYSYTNDARSTGPSPVRAESERPEPAPKTPKRPQPVVES